MCVYLCIVSFFFLFSAIDFTTSDGIIYQRNNLVAMFNSSSSMKGKLHMTFCPTIFDMHVLQIFS
jgi:hypothetical protein